MTLETSGTVVKPAPESSFTLGIEEEFQLIDPESGALVSRAAEVLEGRPSDARFQSELFKAVIETATPVCQGIDEATESVCQLRGELLERAQDQGLIVAAAGTHPWARYEDQDITQSDRYDELRRQVRWPFERSLVFGQHVHVGVGSSEEAVRAMNALRAFVPLLLALSVNAPYWRGLDTGLASVRLRIFESMPRSGLQPRFEDWEDLRMTIDTLRQAGAMEDMTKVWWDIRPRPSLGTVEVRVCDAVPDPELSVALAGLIQAIVARATRAHRTGEHLGLLQLDQVVAENRWRAMRDGTRARLIHLDEDREVDLLAVPEALELSRILLEEEIDALGLEGHMDTLSRVATRHEMGSERQRTVYAETGELKDVILDVAKRTSA